MRIAIGSDHRGYSLKQELIAYLRRKGHEIEDVGVHTLESSDYPAIATKVARLVSAGKTDRGVLICNSGIGMDMAANKFKKIRAANCFNLSMARFSREHNNSNILVFGAGYIRPDLAKRMLRVWIKTEFAQGRHLRRVKMFSEC